MAYTLLGGFFMALADSVPGVSGGTIAFIMGFYDRFISSLHMLLHGNKQDRLNALKFLVKLGCGWIIGMGVAVTLLAGVFTSGIYQISSLFIGMIVASIPLIILEERFTLGRQPIFVLFSVLGAGVVILLSAFNLSGMVHNLGFNPLTAVYVFVAGALAISAMVLPGISGSTLLMSFGLYIPIISTIKEFFALQFTNLWLLVFFGFGVLTGIALSLGSIKKLLDTKREAVIYIVLGMMIGSLYAICMGPTTLKIPQHMMTLSDFNLYWFIAGFFIVICLTLLKSALNTAQSKAASVRHQSRSV